MKIQDMRIGASVRVVGYDDADPAYRQKLLRMGLVKGARLTLARRAPLGDPVELLLRGSRLTLRKAEADALRVEPDGDPLPD